MVYRSSKGKEEGDRSDEAYDRDKYTAVVVDCKPIDMESLQEILVRIVWQCDTGTENERQLSWRDKAEVGSFVVGYSEWCVAVCVQRSMCVRENVCWSGAILFLPFAHGWKSHCSSAQIRACNDSAVYFLAMSLRQRRVPEHAVIENFIK